MGISINNPMISYDIAVTITVASIILTWFILIIRNSNNKNKGHDEKLFKQPPPREDLSIIQNDDGDGDVSNMLQNMSTDNVSVCANCGKEGDDINNICNKCKQVKYCNASCKKKHRSKHKKHCEEHLDLPLS